MYLATAVLKSPPQLYLWSLLFLKIFKSHEQTDTKTADADPHVQLQK